MTQLDWFLRAHPNEVIEAYAEDGSLHEAIAQHIEAIASSLQEAQGRIDVLEPGARNYNPMRIRAEQAEHFLEYEGYRRCDILACNCKLWHQHRPIVGINEALLAALKKAVATIRTWHGMGLPAEAEATTWALYQQSPEMKAINSVLHVVAVPASPQRETP